MRGLIISSPIGFKVDAVFVSIKDPIVSTTVVLTVDREESVCDNRNMVLLLAKISLVILLRARQSRTQAPHPRRLPLPQRSLTTAPRLRPALRNLQRVGHLKDLPQHEPHRSTPSLIVEFTEKKLRRHAHFRKSLSFIENSDTFKLYVR